jgi:hypothetical protein
MQQNGRVFQCEPCRQIMILFNISDSSPYLKSRWQSDDELTHLQVNKGGRATPTLPDQPALKGTYALYLRCHYLHWNRRTRLRVLGRFGKDVGSDGLTRNPHLPQREAMASNYHTADDLEAQAIATLDEARAMPPGLARIEAIKRAGALQAAADKMRPPSFARRGRPPLGK